VQDSTEKLTTEGELSFDLTSRPWVPVQRDDGTQDELSLREVFAEAGSLRRLVGDLPTQEFALLRLLLAVAHDALDGPGDREDWSELWADQGCFEPVAGYLDEHRERFDLLHPMAPFFQVAGLRTARDEVFSLNRIVADVPNGEPFFSSRQPTVRRLDFAEAARWVVHAHAYDTSGIKTGVDGDDRARGGKVYPLGVGWAGTLGGVFAEGDTLRETLLLNLIAADTGGPLHADDRPAWRRPQSGPGAAGGRRPTGVRDLYTWQTRRLRLHFDADGAHGVVLGYGDPLPAHTMRGSEPMTAWRRSRAQERKRGEALVYLPREHDPSRSAWRGLAALIANRAEAAQGSEAPPMLRPGVFEWIGRLVTEGALRPGFLIRARVIGPVYGTQQSVIDEIVDDRLTMAVVLLHERDRAYARQAIGAVSDADDAVRALGDLATDLARASGGDQEGPRATARDLGFGALDGPYRAWLGRVAEVEDPHAHRRTWQREAYRVVAGLGDQLMADAGDAAWQGRIVEAKYGPGQGGKQGPRQAGKEGPKHGGKQGRLWLNSALADQWFRGRLGKALSDPFSDRPPGPVPVPDRAPDSSPRVPV
jgi:CRISPR system Cascade subunit CasA